MRNLLTAFLLTVAALCGGVHPAAGQSAASWKRLTADTVFNYKNELEPVATVNKSASQGGGLERFFLRLLQLFSHGLGSFIFWSAVVGVVVFVVYKVVQNRGNLAFAWKRRNRGVLPAEEEELTGTDWAALMQQAMAADDFALVVRYGYMRLLQLLQERRLIQYRQDKTNVDYLRELESTPFKQQFSQLSRQYEYVYYGKYPVTEAAYGRYIDLFNEVKARITNS
ncbi:MAG: DUF4129 domain-containing protein [Taibaiella sp.]|nr:DUF4129 domain-containing protein [Taibaiella sp.]